MEKRSGKVFFLTIYIEPQSLIDIYVRKYPISLVNQEDFQKILKYFVKYLRPPTRIYRKDSKLPDTNFCLLASQRRAQKI